MKSTYRNYLRLVPTALLVCLTALVALIPGGQSTYAQQGKSRQPDTPVGTGFTYQGQLKDGGNPANGQFDFQFKLYDALSGGNQVGSTLTVSNQTVTEGLFTVLLDFGANAFAGQARWLEIAVRPAGGGSYTTLTPRQPLTAVPYAQSLATGVSGTVISGTVAGPAIVVTNTQGVGIQAYSAGTAGLYGRSSGGYGVQGTGLIGVEGDSTNGSGVEGYSVNGFGVNGQSSSGYGVRGSSSNSYGGYFQTSNGLVAGVFGKNTGTSGIGIYGEATSGSLGYGVWGYSTAGIGVRGNSGSSDGVAGLATAGHAGVQGSGGWGVYGITTVNNGVGVRGDSPAGYGVHGVSTGGWAGWFDGSVNVTGGCCAAAEGTFKIDHPLDPENKYLVQSAVQSADMASIYSGNATTDAKGEAVVTLPSYVEALNKDFRYQLTIMGEQFAQARISSKIKDSRFTIKTDKPNIEVSWQVTGVRQDPYAKAHPIVPEVDKPADEQGLYRHPVEYGQPESKGTEFEKIHQMKSSPESKPIPDAPGR